MDFSFGVLTYNSEKFIIDTLESIKFQVVTYGREKECELIISDDASSDETVTIIEEWLKKNRKIFYNSILLVSDNNEGTVMNYHKVFSATTGKNFHIIAGDDLFSRNNIFEFANKLSKYDIITTFPICLNDKTQTLFIDHRRLQRYIYYSNHKAYTSRQLVDLELFGSFLHTPSTLFRKTLYSDDASDFVKEFKLYEDDPRWLKLLSITSSINYSYVPIVIYRYHEKSVCHSLTVNEFDKDQYKLKTIGRKMTHNFLLKIYLFLFVELLKGRKRGKIAYLIRGIQYVKCKLLNSYKGNTEQIINFMTKELNEEKKYYEHIKRQTEDYRK